MVNFDTANELAKTETAIHCEMVRRPGDVINDIQEKITLHLQFEHGAFVECEAHG